MYNIMIDKSITAVYRDNDNKMMGFLINQEGIKEIIGALPISKYYTVDSNQSFEISKKQAFILYDMIVDYNNNKCKRESKSK